LQPGACVALVLRFHGAAQLLPQPCNSFQIWRAIASDEIPSQKTADSATWLIWCQELVSRYRALESLEQAVLSAMLDGATFADLCELLLNYFSEEETPQRVEGYLQEWINDQLVCEIGHLLQRLPQRPLNDERVEPA
jgi:hypothetical protein